MVQWVLEYLDDPEYLVDPIRLDGPEYPGHLVDLGFQTHLYPEYLDHQIYPVHLEIL